MNSSQSKGVRDLIMTWHCIHSACSLCQTWTFQIGWKWNHLMYETLECHIHRIHDGNRRAITLVTLAWCGVWRFRGKIHIHVSVATLKITMPLVRYTIYCTSFYFKLWLFGAAIIFVKSTFFLYSNSIFCFLTVLYNTDDFHKSFNDHSWLNNICCALKEPSESITVESRQLTLQYQQ